MGNDVIVVLSAMGDTTDELLEKATEINPYPSKRELDMLLTTGEQASVALMAMALQFLNVPAISLNAFQVKMHSTARNGNARFKRVDTDRITHELENRKIVIEDIKKMGDFCIGAACYPEGHVEMEHKKDDIRYLKEKVDCGVDFITTQMFFNNDIFYNFLYRIREQGIMIPVLPGIMPITTKKQLARSCALSGTAVPQRFRAIVDYFGDDPAAMKQAGIAYATDQIIDLIANGVRNIHVYSMNKPEVAAAIMQNLSEIVK